MWVTVPGGRYGARRPAQAGSRPRYTEPYLVSSATSTSAGAAMGALEWPAVGSSVFSSPLVEFSAWRAVAIRLARLRQTSQDPPSPLGRALRPGRPSPGSWCGAELCRVVVAGRAHQGARCRWVSAARADVRTGWSRRCRCSPRTVPDPRPGPSRPSLWRGRPLPPKLPPHPTVYWQSVSHRTPSPVGIST